MTKRLTFHQVGRGLIVVLNAFMNYFVLFVTQQLLYNISNSIIEMFHLLSLLVLTVTDQKRHFDFSPVSCTLFALSVNLYI